MLTLLKNDQIRFQTEMRGALKDLLPKDTAFLKSSEVIPNPSIITEGEKYGETVMGESSSKNKGVMMGDGSHGGQGSGGGPGGGLGGAGVSYIGGGGGANWRFKKLDMPCFDGTNPDGWILRAERYFQFYRLSEEDKIKAAVVALEGDALLWFQWEHRWRPILNWEEMKAMIRRKFRSTSMGSLHEQWLAHQQTGNVGDYRRKFIELLAPLDRVPEEIAKGQFLNGLKEEVRVEVRLLGPTNLDNAMDLALMVEDKLRIGHNKKDFSRMGATSNSKGVSTNSTPAWSTQGSTM